ncbi:uncharacterized protein G2W53_027147 [Senna tora]|uniref:Uncharacterized protein n=1 Tax=Senna tora TaxID=362788 RepID=A0A834WGA9_9FABA|nr:uncharacterized protein G2W53_027147 [Senna tora]
MIASFMALNPWIQVSLSSVRSFTLLEKSLHLIPTQFKLLFDATSALQLDASLQPSTLQLDGAVRERIDAGAVREGESFWLSCFSFLVLAFDFFPNRFLAISFGSCCGFA